MSYGELMREYALQRGLRRLLIRVPVLTPRLSSLWLGLVTPLYARIGRKLIDSIRHPTLVRNLSALADFDIRPVGYREAIAAALRNEDREIAETRWSDAVSSSGATRSWAGVRFGNRLIDSRVESSPVSPEQAFVPIRRIGGDRGWYFADGLWKLRGLLDLLIGGIGLRRSRRDRDQVRVGDTIDCWRVKAYEPDRRLRLFAEMRLPGRAWLEFEVQPTTNGSQIRQTAIFDPVGLAGHAYWYLVYPMHQIVFAGMLRGIVRAGREFVDTNTEPWRPSPRPANRMAVGPCRHLFCRGGRRWGHNLSLGGRLVSNVEEAKLDTAGLAFRSGLVSAIFVDGSLGVARLAKGRLARLTRITCNVLPATHSQHWLVGHFFRNTQPWLRIRRNSDSLACDCRDHRKLLGPIYVRCPNVHALFRLDDIRCFVEFRDLENELVNAATSAVRAQSQRHTNPIIVAVEKQFGRPNLNLDLKRFDYEAVYGSSLVLHNILAF